MTFQYGDIVTYKFDKSSPFLNNIKEYCVIGRLHGKFEPQSVAQVFGWFSQSGGSMMYAFVPEVKSDLDMDSSYIGKPNDSFKSMKLEWGEYPLVNWFIASGDELTNAITPTLLKDFKRRGLCPRCGDAGEWIRLAAICKYHGKFI